MLVLTRKVGKEIVIDSNITVKVISTKKDHVVLGIEAPDSVTVHTREIQDRIDELEFDHDY